MKNIKTRTGIKRPELAVYSTWDRARTEARTLNERNGRGHRALKSTDGKGYSIIFRPSVANNKQRSVREVA